MNIDFNNSPGFSSYVVLLLISGLAMLVIAAINAGGQSVGWRVFNALVGVAFAGYGFYLGFIFTGGTYWIFFKVFIVPIALLVNFFKSMNARRHAGPAGPAAPQVFVPQQPIQQAYMQQPPVQQPPVQPQPYDQVPQYAATQPPAPQQPVQG